MTGKWRRKPIAFLGFAAILMVGCVAFISSPNLAFRRTSTLYLVHAMSRELMRGHLNGSFQGRPNALDASVMEPGDIVLCHNRGGGYGYWTHVVVYVGNGRVVDANDFARGTEIRRIENYRFYDQAAVLRVEGPAWIRERAAASALLEVGKPYDPFAPVTDLHSQYCSKLIWQVYSQQHVRLCDQKPWILPDDLAASKQLHQVACWPAVLPRGGDG